MEIEYKGHRAKVYDEVMWWSMMGPHEGNIYLDSTICSYKIEGVNLCNTVINNILIKWFKDKVDEKKLLNLKNLI